MSDPTPRDTRLFDAGARWATEPTDRRGYGDALRDAVERAGAGVTAAEGEAEREGRHLQVLVQRWHAGDIVALELAQGVGAVAHRLADEPPAPAGLQAEGAGDTGAMTVLRALVEGEDHWTPERDEAYQTAKHRARALVAEGDPYGVDPYGTGDGSYPDPSGGGSS